jgi:ATP-dependent Clp protease protease subunit
MRKPLFRVFAKERPGALPVPAERNISALTMPSVLDRWS